MEATSTRKVSSRSLSRSESQSAPAPRAKAFYVAKRAAAKDTKHLQQSGRRIQEGLNSDNPVQKEDARIHVAVQKRRSETDYFGHMLDTATVDKIVATGITHEELDGFQKFLNNDVTADLDVAMAFAVKWSDTQSNARGALRDEFREVSKFAKNLTTVPERLTFKVANFEKDGSIPPGYDASKADGIMLNAAARAMKGMRGMAAAIKRMFAPQVTRDLVAAAKTHGNVIGHIGTGSAIAQPLSHDNLRNPNSEQDSEMVVHVVAPNYSDETRLGGKIPIPKPIQARMQPKKDEQLAAGYDTYEKAIDTHYVGVDPNTLAKHVNFIPLSGGVCNGDKKKVPDVMTMKAARFLCTHGAAKATAYVLNDHELERHAVIAMRKLGIEAQRPEHQVEGGFTLID